MCLNFYRSFDLKRSSARAVAMSNRQALIRGVAEISTEITKELDRSAYSTSPAYLPPCACRRPPGPPCMCPLPHTA